MNMVLNIFTYMLYLLDGWHRNTSKLSKLHIWFVYKYSIWSWIWASIPDRYPLIQYKKFFGYLIFRILLLCYQRCYWQPMQGTRIDNFLFFCYIVRDARFDVFVILIKIRSRVKACIEQMLSSVFIIGFPASRGMLIYPDRGHSLLWWFTSAYQKALPMRTKGAYFCKSFFPLISLQINSHFIPLYLGVHEGVYVPPFLW